MSDFETTGAFVAISLPILLVGCGMIYALVRATRPEVTDQERLNAYATRVVEDILAPDHWATVVKTVAPMHCGDFVDVIVCGVVVRWSEDPRFRSVYIQFADVYGVAAPEAAARWRAAFTAAWPTLVPVEAPPAPRKTAEDIIAETDAKRRELGCIPKEKP